MPYTPRSTYSSAATGEAVDEASATKPGGGSNTVSRCDIQQVCSAGRPGEQPAGLAHLQLGAPELPDVGALDAAAELARDQLHPVADAQHRDAELEQRRVEVRRALGVHGRGAAGQDQSLRLALRHGLHAGVMRQQLGEDAQLAHAPRDQLRVLPAVVEDDDFLGRHARLRAHRRARR